MNTEFNVILKKDIWPVVFDYFEKNGYLEKNQQIDHTFELINLAVDILNRVGVSKDVDFVKKEVEGLLRKVFQSVDDFANDLNKSVDDIVNATLNIDVDSSLMGKTKVWLREQLESVKKNAIEAAEIIIDSATTASKSELSGIQNSIESIGKNLDPEWELSYLGKLKAVINSVQSNIENLLNPQNMDGFTFKLNEKIEYYFGEQSSPILLAVQTMFDDYNRTFTEQLTKLREEVAQRLGIDTAMEKTAVKGFIFEDEVEKTLMQLSRSYSDIPTRVSLDKRAGKKGDFIYEFSDSNKRVVIECKDQSIGLTPTLKYLDEAMENRECSYSIVVTKELEQLPSAVGGFNLYVGNKLFCSYENLEVALRFYRLYLNVVGRKGEKGEVDKTKILDAVEIIKNELVNVRNIKTKLTGVDKFVQSENKKIKDIVENMQEHVNLILTQIENELK